MFSTLSPKARTSLEYVRIVVPFLVVLGARFELHARCTISGRRTWVSCVHLCADDKGMPPYSSVRHHENVVRLPHRSSNIWRNAHVGCTRIKRKGRLIPFAFFLSVSNYKTLLNRAPFRHICLASKGVQGALSPLLVTFQGIILTPYLHDSNGSTISRSN